MRDYILALVGSALFHADHHLMNNNVFLWLAVSDYHPLPLSVANEKEYKTVTPMGLLVGKL